MVNELVSNYGDFTITAADLNICSFVGDFPDIFADWLFMILILAQLLFCSWTCRVDTNVKVLAVWNRS